jgi:phosphopantothenoylcysteine decarboxylase/phosphopantothenate--cysteine ligase
VSQSLHGERVLLGVCGGIAAYKAAGLVRRLREAGAEVRVVVTEGAMHFVGAATFQALSGNPVRSSLWDAAAEAAMGHIELARWATRVLVAPATADMLAKLAHGHADDLLSTLCLATVAPLAIAPAMNNRMWLHPATQANLDVLRGRGVQVIGPADGEQACGETGPGRLLEPDAIVLALAQGAAPPPQTLRDVRVMISAGPTFEDLDPVRYLGNRSSGKMGFALAAAAAALGAQVTLVAGPTALATPAGVRRIDVRRATEMRDAVLAALPQDIYIGAAAVADYMPRHTADQKLKKSAAVLVLELIRTPDILAEVAQYTPRPRLVVGFAAETGDLESSARGKLVDKQLDLIAANRVGVEGSGFESDDNALSVYWNGGQAQLGPAPKTRLAHALLALIAQRMENAS